jgi:ABC-type glycerol-3-phosphate transport system substrate-binding protein
MPRQKTEAEAAAEYICVQLHPVDLRSDYVRNIRVYYHAEAIVYVLQALSAGMTSLFVGLVTNYLYDKAKKPDQKLVDMHALLKKQQEKLDELQSLIAKENKQNTKEVATQHLELHKKTLLQIQDSDPSIAAMVDDALRQLEQRGQNALTDDVDSNYR